MYLWNPKRVKLLRPQKRSRVEQHTRLPAFVAVSGASPGVLLGSQRLSSSKGQTRRETGTQSHGPRYSPMVARPPKGWAGEEPVRPRARILMDLGRSARYIDPGTGMTSYAAACPATFLHPQHLA